METLTSQLDGHAPALHRAHQRAVLHTDLQILLQAVQACFVSSPDRWNALLCRSLLATDVKGACSDAARAAELKASGNAAFQSTDYAEAVELYTSMLNAVALNAALCS